MTIQEAYEEWVETLQIEHVLSPATIKQYTGKTSLILREVDDLSSLTLKRTINRIAHERNWHPGSVYQCVASVRSFLRFCLKRGFISQFDLPLPKVPERLPRPIPREHLTKILQVPIRPYQIPYCDHRDKLLIHVMLFCGLRVAETAGLDCEDCNLGTNTLHVRHAKGGRHRNIPLIGELAEELYKYLLLRARFYPIRDDPALFLSNQRKRLCVHTVRYAFHRHLKECGLDGYSYTCHSLRHSFATLLIEGGAEIRAIQELLGHRKIETTLLYTKVTEQHMRREIQKHPLTGFL